MDPLEPELPLAELRPVRRLPVGWALLAVGALLLLFVAWSAWQEQGPTLALLARDGRGIRAGDALRYRGIRVGNVERVTLAADLGQVEIEVRLDPEAERLARAGSRYWVVRPHIGLDRLEGIETLLGARYLAVAPGAADGPVQNRFQCLEEAPVASNRGGGALEFVLEAPRRMGILPRAPLTYRQVEVGRVLSVGLASDARTVDVWCEIDAPYRELVRENTAFWRAGGFRLALEFLDGLSVDVDSLRSLLGGGIALATPNREASSIHTGARLTLRETAPKGALDWEPSLAVGARLLPLGTPPVPLLRARILFEEGFFGRDHERSGWLVLLPGGIVGPEDLLASPEGADGPALEVHGERLPLLAPPVRTSGGLAQRGIRFPELVPWPRARVRTLEAPEDCVIRAAAAEAPVALAASRLEPRPDAPGRFRIDPAISFDASWHGAAVQARSDGDLVGILRVRGGRGVLLPLSGLVADDS